MWVALQRSPPLYPDAITLAPGVDSDTAALAVVPGRGCSVKDSFAELDLRPHGFELLFEALWIYRRPADPGPPVELGWTAVESEQGLDRFSQAAGDAIDVPLEVLRDPDVCAVAGPGMAAGAIANRTGSVVGIGNVFGQDGVTAATWIGVTSVLDAAYPGTPMVGYEHGDGIQAALGAGFEAVGALRVWLTP